MTKTSTPSANGAVHPSATSAGVSISADLIAGARASIEKGSSSFATASKLFAPEVRASCHLLYAWCRHCDDVIDGQDHGHDAHTVDDARAALTTLQVDTTKALAGHPIQAPVFQGLQAVVAKHGIAHRHPFDHLEGFRMDVDADPMSSIEDTLRYCYHVAGVVGVMMAQVMGAQSEPALDRASDLGIAFQLTNIARDIVPDAQQNRVYLPDEWLRDVGLDRASVALPQHRQRVFSLAERLIGLAEGYYQSAYAGLGALPLRSAAAVGTARSVYREIGREILRRGPSAWDRRVSTSKKQKLGALLSGVTQAMATRQSTTWHPRQGLYNRPAS